MATVSISIANRSGTTYQVNSRHTLLTSLEAHGLSLPYGCKYGGCITCAAKLIEGRVDQKAQVALNNRQLDHGYILLCIARPLTDCTIAVGIDSHDTLYRNPFADPLGPHELKPSIADRGEDT